MKLRREQKIAAFDGRDRLRLGRARYDYVDNGGPFWICYARQQRVRVLLRHEEGTFWCRGWGTRSLEALQAASLLARSS